MSAILHPPGTVGIAAGEFTRFGGFVHSLSTLAVPPGTRIMMMQSVSIVENMNTIVRETLGHPEMQWLHIQADDHIFSSTSLVSLLDRDLDVVVPLICRRAAPFVPVAYTDLNDDGYMPIGWDELPDTGTVEVFAAGTGGMLIRRHVLEAIGEPHFEYEAGVRLNEDLVLCRKIRDAGFTIHLDVDVQYGHRGSFTAWPQLSDDGWGVGLDLGASASGRRTQVVIKPTEHERMVI